MRCKITMWKEEQLIGWWLTVVAGATVVVWVWLIVVVQVHRLQKNTLLTLKSENNVNAYTRLEHFHSLLTPYKSDKVGSPVLWAHCSTKWPFWTTVLHLKPCSGSRLVNALLPLCSRPTQCFLMRPWFPGWDSIQSAQTILNAVRKAHSNNPAKGLLCFSETQCQIETDLNQHGPQLNIWAVCTK